MSAKKRTFKMEKLARVYDDEVLPVWSQRFGKMLLRSLEVAPRSQVLDVACGTGYPAVEVLRRMDDASRLIAIDASSAMLDVARKKIAELGNRNVFFRTEAIDPKLSFADDVYDLTICNLGLSEMDDPVAALTDLARVTRPGGQVRCTLPLEGTFQEFFDIYREVLTKHDKQAAQTRLAEHLAARYPSAERAEQWLERAGLIDRQLEVEEFRLLFKSSREFFFAPVIEYGPLMEWKEIAGAGQDMQDVFWYIKEAIDAYFGNRAFEVTVKAGCLIGTVPELVEDAITDQVPRVRLEDAFEPEPTPQVVELGEVTSEINIDELEEVGAGSGPTTPIRPPTAEDEEPLEAFVDGARRPPHLDSGEP